MVRDNRFVRRCVSDGFSLTCNLSVGYMDWFINIL
jgi:hypothetical protein